MLPKDAKKNEFGRRIGESHPRAVLTDHDVDLLLDLLAEREVLVDLMRAEGCRQAEIDEALRREGLSYRCIAIKLEVSKGHVWKIASGRRRCQAPA